MQIDPIPFNKPYMTGDEIRFINQAYSNGKLAGDGEFTQYCHRWLESHIGCQKALLTHSCTAALEMCALLMNIQPGDEIILPSYTFVSTANAFVLRGGIPVFVDVRADTLNIDETRIEHAITSRTRAIIAVHYAGVGCEMDEICAIARDHKLVVIEDAAQGIVAQYKGRPLGSIGDLSTLSFHETKNVISGEGGALLINSETYTRKAEIVREKGTDRSQFFRGEVDKYTWQSKGSSFLPGELVAAFLRAQLSHCDEVTSRRKQRWNRYHQAFQALEEKGTVRRPIVPDHCSHNAHIYYLLLNPGINRDELLNRFRIQGIGPVFHYVPLHNSPAGLKYGRASGQLTVTEDLSARLIRLPLWVELSDSQQDRVVDVMHDICETFN